jgi:hypothetical protein
MAPTGNVRASDQDREHAVRLLNEHAIMGRLTGDEHQQRIEAAYAARSLGDLAALMEDLPVRPVPATGRADRSYTPRRRFTAITGSSLRSNRSRLARRATCLAIMASPDIDLCRAELDGDEIEIRAFAFFGWPNIYVPDSVRVELPGTPVRPGPGGRTVISYRTAAASTALAETGSSGNL